MTELRHSIRGLLRTPAFTAVVVLTLALGVGANAAIFSVVDAVLLRPLSYPAANRIVSFAWQRQSGLTPANVSPLGFQYWRDQARAFHGFAVVSPGSFTLSAASSAAERVRGVSATADFFKVIGVAPARGRAFLPEDAVPDAAAVAVISHGLWQRLFGGAPDVVGRSIALNDRPHTVIGVMPADFAPEPAADVVAPLQLRVDPRDRGLNYTVMARLREGVTLAQAQSETDRLFERFKAEYPQHMPRATLGVGLIRYQDFLVADMRTLLLVLLGAVGLVLLIACGNVANLLLSRSAARQREIAIRSALGAGTTRLARQILTESLLLSLAGGAAGIGLAAAGVRALIALIPGALPRLGSVAVDGRVLAFAIAVSLAAGIVFALVGTARLLKSDPGAALKAGAGTGVDLLRHRLANTLVVAQVALSVVLLTGAGLLAATFMNLRGIPIGFDTGNMLTVQLSVSSARYRTADAPTRLDRELIDRLSGIPGVVSVTTASSIPLERGPNFVIGVEGQPRETIHYAEIRAVGPNYFSTLGIPVMAGNGATTTESLVVNEALARLLGGPTAALGQRVVVGQTTAAEDVPRAIGGVVSNVADGRPGTRLFPTLYVPRAMFGGASVAVLIRTAGRVTIAPDVRRVIQEIDAQLPIVSLRSMHAVAAAAVAQQRFNMTLIGVFAAVALALTMVGLYGLLSYQVAQRTREIGVRVALGARRSEVLRLVATQGLALTAAGLAIGIAGSIGLARFLKTLLFGVSATSPWILACVALVLLTVAVVASLIPARRATQVDPVLALRAE